MSDFRLGFIGGGRYRPPRRHCGNLVSAGSSRVLTLVSRSQAHPARSPDAAGGFDREPELPCADGSRSAVAGDNDRPGPDQVRAVRSGVVPSPAIGRVPSLNRSCGHPAPGQSGKSNPLPDDMPREATPGQEAGILSPDENVI